MILLVLGLVVFTGVHLLRELGLRNRLISRFGMARFRLIYSVLALLGILLMAAGMARSPFIMIYDPTWHLQNISNFAMLPAFILVMAGNLPPSIIRATVRHPMLLGTFIWGGAHLWANGDLASLLLFGGIGLWALVKFCSQFGSQPSPGNPPRLRWDAAAVTLGFIIYALVAYYHGPLFGKELRFV